MIFNMTIDRIPVAKGRPRFHRCGNFIKTYTPTKTKDEEKIIATMIRQEWTFEPVETPLSVSIEFYMPIPKSFSKKRKNEIELGQNEYDKRPDLDNLAKLVLDAMNGLVFKDDALIHKLNLVKCYSSKPRIYICINTGLTNPMKKEKKKYNCICSKNF